jgi:hypothetical protein
MTRHSVTISGRAHGKSTLFDTIRGVRIKPEACKECQRMLACAIEGESVDPSASCIETCQSFKNDKQNNKNARPSGQFLGSQKPTHPVLGDTYMDVLTQTLYIYHSTGWKEVSK